MKKVLGLLGLLLLQCTASGATAHIDMYCLSIRVYGATIEPLGWDQTLYFSKADPLAVPITGELWPSMDPVYTHESNLTFDDEIYGKAPGFLLLDLPLDVDTNDNGIEDILEFDVDIPAATTVGLLYDPAPQPTRVNALWSRVANEHLGLLSLELNGRYIKGNFDHYIEIWHYTGTIDYTKSGTNVTATLSLVRNGEPTMTFTSKLAFSTSGTDTVLLADGKMTNNVPETLDFLDAEFERNGKLYDALFIFQDGDLATSFEDFDFWIMRIRDENDADSDGIPDFSDGGLPPARAPKLSISPGQSKLTIAISGDVGRQYRLEKSASVVNPSWSKVADVTLNADPHPFEVSLPAETTQFWRAVVP